MAEHFEVGEVAIYWRPGTTSHMTEVTVISALHHAPYVDGVTGAWGFADVYEISVPDGLKHPHKVFVALPSELRKKKPPQRELDKLVSWEDIRNTCKWVPNREVTTV